MITNNSIHSEMCKNQLKIVTNSRQSKLSIMINIKKEMLLSLYT